MDLEGRARADSNPIRRTCAAIGMEEPELARRLDVSRKTISNYIAGRHRPSLFMLHRMRSVLGDAFDLVDAVEWYALNTWGEEDGDRA